MINDMSLKAKIRNLAREKNISAQAILQSYLMERFLLRLSQSEYLDKFVVKGGILISSIVGIDHRSTMDLDTTLRNLPLTETSIHNAFDEICSIKNDDGIEFIFESIGPIREDDEYGGYRVCFTARYGKINAPMSMDVSTGDIITPGAEKHTFTDILNHSETFDLWSYTIETILAEKTETILSRGVDNTRPRDFYDVYMLSVFQYNPILFREAFIATGKHRGSFEKIMDYEDILKSISGSPEMQKRWTGYVRQMPYAAGISFDIVVEAVYRLLMRV